MKKKIVYFFGLILLIASCFFSGMTVFADGGQVRVDGQITFYEESSTSDTSTTDSSSSGTSTSPSSSSVAENQSGGKLPQTGEQIKNYSFIGGGVLLVTGLLFFLVKKKGKEE